MVKHQMFIAAALFAGVAIGYFVKDEPISAEEPKTEAVEKKPIADKGAEAGLKALRKRVAELEAALAEKTAQAEAAASNAVAAARPPEPPRGNLRERMEAMRKSDPARYAQMTNRFAQWRQSRAEQARTRLEFLSSIDTSRMGAGARKTHEALQELIARREDLEAQLHNPDLSDEDRGKLMHELRSMHGELQRLNGEERQNLIAETARNLGFEGDDVKEIAATIREVIEATDGGFGFPRHGGHRGGSRPGEGRGR